MFKRGRRYYNENDNARDLSEADMIFMGIGGKEMTDLELLKREEQDLLARKMMRHRQQNSLQGSGPRGSGGPLTPKMVNCYFKSSNPPHGGGDARNNVMSQEPNHRPRGD